MLKRHKARPPNEQPSIETGSLETYCFGHSGIIFGFERFAAREIAVGKVEDEESEHVYEVQG